MTKKRNKILEKILNSITPEEHARYEQMIEKSISRSEELKNQGYKWNTDKSYSIKLLRDHGHKPIGITNVMCEETFIFNSKEECDKAHWEMQVQERLVDGWWYSKEEFEKMLSTEPMFQQKNGKPKIYWLNED
jgi:hypothetical protein